jgi:hypothetical protein
MSEFQGRRTPCNAKEIFNLRHSSLRTTVERAFGALKGRFRILDNKPFHPYKYHVQIVIACCILHNWILGYGVDEIIPGEDFFEELPQPGNVGSQTPMSQETREWAAQRDAWAIAMWVDKGSSRV